MKETEEEGPKEFKKCGEGDNVCSCTKESDCGYIKIHEDVCKSNKV